MKLGKGVVNQNMSVIPFEQRADFDAASMTPDTEVWRLIDAFTTHNGSWEPDNSDPWAIEQWARDKYLFPPSDPRYNREGGADHHLQILVLGAGGERLNQAGVAYSSNGAETLQPAGAGVIFKTTLDHGWANIPIFAPPSYPPTPGPWSMTKAPGMADILTGAGLPANNHVTTFGVWQAVRWGDLQPDYATLQDALLGEAQAHQVIEFNPDAALQKVIYADGYHINSREFDVTFGGIDYVAQRAERLDNGNVRVYYVERGHWGDVRHVVRP